MPPKHGVAAAIHDDGDGGHVQDTTPLVGEHAIERVCGVFGIVHTSVLRIHGMCRTKYT